MSSEEYPVLDPTEVITISLTEAYIETTSRSTQAIHCMQWNSSCSKWDIEDQPMKHPIEIPGLELR
jgi:hypothetical protein